MATEVSNVLENTKGFFFYILTFFQLNIGRSCTNSTVVMEKKGQE
jgi:hypothetical protein